MTFRSTWVALAILTLLAGAALLTDRLPDAHDTLAYLPRFVEFHEVLSGGILLPRWAPDLGAGYGEPTFNYNPPLLYYLGAAFRLLGCPFTLAQNLSALALLALAGTGMYRLAAALYGPRAGVVAAAAYLFAPFLQLRVYVSCALADVAGMAVLPWLLEALLKPARWRAAGVATAALMLSSISVALVSLPLLALGVLAGAWRERSRERLSGALSALALGLALSAWFWVPALVEGRYVHLERRVRPGLTYAEHFVPPARLLYSPWGFGQSPDGLSFGLGPIHLALGLLSLPLLLRQRALGLTLVMLAASLFMTTAASAWLWEVATPLHPMQFPWRFLSFSACLLALVCAAPFRVLSGAWAGLAVAALVACNLGHARPQAYLAVTDADYTPERIARAGLAATARDFEPRTVRQFPSHPSDRGLTVLSGQAEIRKLPGGPTEQRFEVRVERPADLQLGTFYFPGWALWVDGQSRPLSVSAPEGLIRFALPPGQHRVRVVFSETPLRTACTLVSLLAAIALLAGWKPPRSVAGPWQLVPVLVSAVWLWPEVAHRPLNLNDSVIHLYLVRAILASPHPLDFWSPQWECGLPLMACYQHLGHLTLAGLHHLTQVPPEVLFPLSLWALLSLWPLAVYQGMRWLDCDRASATMASWACLALSCRGSYGFAWDSYLFGGFGLWAQLWAMTLFPLALGQIWRALFHRGSLAGAAFLAAAVFLCHFMAGCCLALAGVLMLACGGSWRRLTGMALLAGLLALYQLATVVVDAPYRNAPTVWMPRERLMGLGAGEALRRLADGSAFQLSGRGLSLAVLGGLALAAGRRRRVDAWLAAGFCLYVALWFGPSFWGPALERLGGEFHFERLAGPVQLFGIMLAGRFLGWALTARSGLGAALALVLLLPGWLQLAAYARWNQGLVEAQAARQAADYERLDPVLKASAHPELGRIWAGPPGSWGRTERVGQVPLYQVLADRQLPLVGFMAFSSSLVCDFQGTGACYEARPAWRELFGVRYWVGPAPPPGGSARELARAAGVGAWELPDPGWFRVVEAPVLVKTDRFRFKTLTLAWLDSTWPEEGRHLLLDFQDRFSGRDFERTVSTPAGDRLGPGDGERGGQLRQPEWLAPRPGASPPGEVLAQACGGPGEFRARARLQRPAFLLLKVSYHPAWAFEVDGREVTPAVLSPGMPAVRLDRGEHTVRAFYRPRWWRLPLALLGLLGLLAGVWFERYTCARAQLMALPTVMLSCFTWGAR